MMLYVQLLQVLTILAFTALSNQQEEHQPQYYNDKEDEYPKYQKKSFIPILKHTFEQDDQSYKFSYQTGNGIHAQETGFIKNKGDEKNEILIQQGSVTYHDEHGNPITLTYVADENGFHPQGSHLPTPPPVPEEIRKALENQGHDSSMGEEQETQASQQHLNYMAQNQVYDYLRRQRRY